MNTLSKPKRAHSGNSGSSAAGNEPQHAIPTPRRRPLRWGHIATVGLIATIAFWAIGRETAKHIENNDIEVSSRRQPPLPECPKASRTADNNNALMRSGLVPDLEGTAIPYAAEADGLVSGGQFRTDLRPDELAAILEVNPDSIANPRSPGEIDPDAELFPAQAGRLTQKARDISRQMRKQRLLKGKTPDAVFEDWAVTRYSFTLNRLKHPSDEERKVLDAIVRSAAAIMPKPGDKIRAVPLNRGDLEDDRKAPAAGMLPVESPQQRPDAAVAQR